MTVVVTIGTHETSAASPHQDSAVRPRYGGTEVMDVHDRGPDPNAPPPLDERSGAELAVRAVTAAQLAMVVTAAQGPAGQSDDPVVWANEAFCRLTGYALEEVLGRNCRFLQGPSTDPASVHRLAGDLHAGRTAAGTLLNYHRNGTPFWNRLVVTPVRDADGRITHHLGIATDATVQVMTERAREAELELEQSASGRLELLARVSDALAEHLDYREAADTLADIAVPSLAQWGFVALLDEHGAFEHLRIATVDPAKSTVARTLEGLDHAWLLGSATVREAVRADPEDVLMPRVMDTHRLLRVVGADHHALLAELGLGSWLIVPLFARNHTLGLLGLVRADDDGFDVRTVVTATHLGRRVGLALDNARLYLAERTSALTLQHRLLPRVIDVPGLDVSATYLPSEQRAEVGGDWYDVLPVELPVGPDEPADERTDERTGEQTSEHGAVFTVGDIVGHDMTAAAAMGQVSSLLRARQWGGASPAQVLTALASLLDDLGWDDVATVVCLRSRRHGDQVHVEYVNAGHPAPFVRLPDGTVFQLPRAQTLPVGLMAPGTVVHDEELTLPAGSTVVMYTDGLVERRDRSLADGLAALEQALRDAPDGTAAQIRDHLVSTLVDGTGEDDLCLLVVRGPAPDPA